MPSRGRRLALALSLALLLHGGAALAAPPPEEEAPPVPAADPPPLPPVRTLRLTLAEAVALALRNNPDLHAASYGPPIAEQGLLEATALYDHLFVARAGGGERKVPTFTTLQGNDAQLSDDLLTAGVGIERRLPSGGAVSLEASMDRTLTNSSFALLNPYWDAGLGLRFRQPLLRGFGKAYTESGVRLAEDSRDLALLDLRGTTEDLVRRVETAYWQLVRARGTATARRKALEVAEDLLRVNEARLRAGAGTRVEVSQAAAGVAARRVDMLRAENDLRSSEEILLGFIHARHAAAPGDEDLRVEAADDPAENLPPLPVESVEAAVEGALLHRTDIRARKVLVDRAEVAVLLAESDALARLDLAAEVTYAGIAGNLGSSWGDGVATRENATWNVGLVLEVPIGNRAGRARLQRAILSRSQAESLVRALESAASVNVRNARREVESAREQIAAAARATALAEEQLEAERERLRNDKSTTFSVLRLESDLTDARLSELRSQADYRTALARYDFERGRILESRGIVPPDR